MKRLSAIYLLGGILLLTVYFSIGLVLEQQVSDAVQPAAASTAAVAALRQLYWVGGALGLAVIGWTMAVYAYMHFSQGSIDQAAVLPNHNGASWQMLESLPDAVFLIDPHHEAGDWLIVECNSAACEMNGYSREELIGQSIDILHVTQYTREHRDAYLRTLRHAGINRLEVIHRRKDGKLFMVETATQAIMLRGREFVLGIDRDVSQDHATQTTLEQYSQAMLALNKTAVVITSALQVDEILLRLVEAAERVFPQALAVTVQLLDKGGDTMQTAQASASLPGQPSQIVFRAGKGIAGHAMAERRLINVPDVLDDARFIPPSDHALKYRALLVAPLMTSNNVWGTLSIEGKEAFAFGMQDELLADLLARQVGVAIENAHLYEAEQRQRQIAETLQDIGLAFTGALRQEDVLKNVLEQAARVLPYSAAGVWLLRPDGSYYCFSGVGYADFGLDPASSSFKEWQPDETSIMLRVIDTNRVVIVPDVSLDPGWVSWEAALWIRSWAGAPIYVRGDNIGVLTFDHTEPGFYGPQHQAILETLATQISIAVENALLFEQVQDYALGLQKQVMARTRDLHVQQEQMETILRSIDDAVLVGGLDGRALYVNEAFYRLLGWQQEEVVGTLLHHYVHPAMPRQLLRGLVHDARRRRAWRGEMLLRHRDGYPVAVDVIGVPYRPFGDEVEGYIASLRNLGEERAVERMKARFMTLVTHELGTPMMNLKLHLHLLSRSLDDPERRATYLGTLEEQIVRLNTLLDKVITATRLADAIQPDGGRTVHINSLLDQIAVRYADEAAGKDLQLTVTPGDPDWPPLRGDQEWLFRACHEIVENALAYTPTGGTITVQSDLCEREGRRFVALSTRDTGPGISAEDMTELNAPFIRVGAQQAGESAGIGLGLSIVRSVVERHGGRLHVESEPGQGSTFILYLPIVE